MFGGRGADSDAGERLAVHFTPVNRLSHTPFVSLMSTRSPPHTLPRALKSTCDLAANQNTILCLRGMWVACNWELNQKPLFQLILVRHQHRTQSDVLVTVKMSGMFDQRSEFDNPAPRYEINPRAPASFALVERVWPGQ